MMSIETNQFYLSQTHFGGQASQDPPWPFPLSPFPAPDFLKVSEVIETFPGRLAGKISLRAESRGAAPSFAGTTCTRV